MSQNVSVEHSITRLNGHEMEGWAAVADALLFPDNTLANFEVGPDGLKVVSSTGMKGGEVTFKLQQNSVSAQFLMQQHARILGGAVVEFEMTYANSQTGVSVRCDRGHLQQAPFGPTQGNAVAPFREFMIHFESILPNYDGARTTRVSRVSA